MVTKLNINIRQVSCTAFSGSPVAAVGEGCDDQSRSVAEVLVAVLYRRRDHGYPDAAVLGVVPQLTDPVEVGRRRHIQFCQLLHHVSS